MTHATRPTRCRLPKKISAGCIWKCSERTNQKRKDTSMNTKPIPDGYDSLIPYLIVRDAAKAIEFYKSLFGATELLRMPYPNSAKIMHAELKIRNSVFMLTEESQNFGQLSPLSLNGQP